MPSFNLVVPTPVRRVRILSKEEAATATAPVENGYESGFDAGYKAGLLQAEYESLQRRKRDAELLSVEMRHIEQAHKELGRLHEELKRIVSSHLPHLVLTALSRVLNQHHFTNEEVAKEVTGLLKELSLAKNISIECSPENIKTLQVSVEGDSNSQCQAGIEWIPNPALKAGEYILRSDLGVLDGRRMTRMAHVQTALKAIL